ncbi:MAG TPA: flavodoxin family protein [Bacteroidales bacterium]|nr:flavodoxin family protein [Bacteroidales bacterium]HPI68202.1 flavodoxin family protein [Bacteroidales bacterium]HPR72584.1 flavodoxin family protein [Bacteroidales bacterium]
MKVLGINCSPRIGGNTEILIKEVFRSLENNGIDTEFFQLGGKSISGCTACMKCREIKDGRCHQDNEVINSCIERMERCDGLLIGAPVYFADVASDAKALIDVAGYAMRGAGNPLRRKVGAAVLSMRRAGAVNAFDTVNHFFLINEMIIPGSSYWNMGIGREKGDVLKDEEGLNTMRVLGENMAYLLKRLHNGQ